jgi:N-sulfoglucosamine sulfohydrolase
MRCVRTEKLSYIYNAWPDGKTVFKNEPQSGLTFKAMQAAGEKDAKIAERVKFFLYRTREELYDMEADPIELHNLAADEKYKSELDKMRGELLKMMTATNDPLLPKFKGQVLP